MSGLLQGPILVCFAVKEEAAPFRRELPPNVTILVTGMGAAAAERVVKARLSERDWSLVLTCCFPGGLHPALRLARSSARQMKISPAPDVAQCRGGRRAASCRTGGDRLREGDAPRAHGCGHDRNGIGVIRRLCHGAAFPATVRVISDTAQETCPWTSTCW